MCEQDNYSLERRKMVSTQIQARGVEASIVLKAMEQVPRHEFVDGGLMNEAYGDYPLSIGHGQTISQPYIVAYMTEALGAGAGQRILEIGTGCGYQTAVLSETGAEVFTIEIVEELADQAKERLLKLGYRVRAKIGDGNLGWPEEAPFDGIIVTAAPEEIPKALVEQLAENGRLIIPVGRHAQVLKVCRKRYDALEELTSMAVRFVPLVSHHN